MATVLHFVLSLLLTAAFRRVSGYVPASPTNDTIAIQQTMNETGASKLHLQWSNGSYWENVSYQLVAANSTGISQGAFVHFSERNATNITLPTMTPWIAMVSCDYNATDASQEEDIFTLARDLGAVSALLYSLHSQGCIINPAYEDPSVFNQILDIFTTQSLTSAHLIDYQFGQFGTNDSAYDYYNSQLLNKSFTDVNQSITTGNPVSPGYLIATLVAYNASLNNTDDDGNGQSSSTDTNGGSSNTGLAMIVLYAITGCVSALFCVVIISGAIRAIRHPDRYGPRMAVHNGGVGEGQSRARGLTRAILDTFPVVKFAPRNHELPAKDPEEGASNSPCGQNTASRVEMKALDDQHDMDSGDNDASAKPPVSVTTATGSEVGAEAIVEGSSGTEHVTEKEGQDDPTTSRPDSGGSVPGQSYDHVGRRSGGVGSSSSSRSPAGGDMGEGPSRPLPPLQTDVASGGIGRETCPICIVDFEEGDDLRLLPCEGKHRFHQDCVDPWLLELSSSCPICRQDFFPTGPRESDDGENWEPPHAQQMNRQNSQRHRFSRYSISARRRNRAQAEEEVTDGNPPEAEV